MKKTKDEYNKSVAEG